MVDRVRERAAPGPAPSAGLIFISYSRVNLNFAKEIYAKLASLGFKPWRDRSDIEAGKDWWQQIQASIRSAGSMVLLVSPSAIASPIVLREFRYARAEGVRIIPILVETIDFSIAPYWLARLDCIDFRPGAAEAKVNWRRFLEQLKEPYDQIRIPFGAPPLPEAYVERSSILDQLMLLITEGHQRVTNPRMVAIQGNGGSGKSVLAQALCHRQEIEDVFADGVIWVTLGGSPDLHSIVVDQIELLTGTRPQFVDINAAVAHLRTILETRRLLIVLDDVWDDLHVLPFLGAGSGCRYVVTTRSKNVPLLLGARTVDVGELTDAEALTLLQRRVGPANSKLANFGKLANMLGNWVLLIDLASAYIGEAVFIDGSSVVHAVDGIFQRFADRGVTALDRAGETERTRAIGASLNFSIDRLGPWRKRFWELAIFPEDIDIPVTAIGLLWRERARLTDLETEDALKAINRLSLFTLYDAEAGIVRLHDVVRGYLLQMPQEIDRVHSALVDAWPDPYTLPDDYAWRRYAYHLKHAGRDRELQARLSDFRWLRAKLSATEVNGLIADFDMVEVEDYRSIQGALQLAAQALMEDPAQLPGQLRGRLMAHTSPLVRSLADSAAEQLMGPALLPLSQCLTSPDSLLRRTIQCGLAVTAAVLTPDGSHLITGQGAVFERSGSSLALWDLRTGKPSKFDEGNSPINMVDAIGISSDGTTVVSTENLSRARVWDLGSRISILEFNTPVRIGGIVVERERAVLYGREGAFVFDLRDGSLIHSLGDEEGGLRCFTQSRDGSRGVTASASVWKLWDMTRGVELKTAQAGTNSIICIDLDPLGKVLAVGAKDGTIQIWNLERGAVEATLEGHQAPVVAIRFAADSDRMTSISADGYVYVWNLLTGEVLFAVEEPGIAEQASISLNGQFSVSFEDAIVKVWDLRSPRILLPSRRRPSSRLSDLRLSADGTQIIAVTISGDLQLWDSRTATKLSSVAVHSEPISAVDVASNGEVISATRSGYLGVTCLPEGLSRIWRGHQDAVTSLAVAPEGTLLVSGSESGEAKAWDLISGKELFSVKMHDSAVLFLEIAHDGKHILSADGSDGVFKVWSRSGRLLRTVSAHSDKINLLEVVPYDSVIVSSAGGMLSHSDTSLKLWDSRSYNCLWSEDGHAQPVYALQVLQDKRYIAAAQGSQFYMSYSGIEVFDLEEKTILFRYWDRGWINSISGMPGTDFFACCYSDGSLEVKDIRSGEFIAALNTDQSLIRCVVSSDGTTIAALDYMGRLCFVRLVGV